MKEFNIFKFLSIESKETIHSQFIASILQADGKFYNLFMEQIPIKDNLKLEFKSVWIKTEVNLKSRDKTESYGRADIMIQEYTGNRRKRIIIENKIHAGEQWKQLDRYLNYINKEGVRDGIVYYLTLQGKTSNTASGKYEILSYQEHIIPWLEKVSTSDKCNELLKLMIKHYISIVNELTKYQRLLNDNEQLENVPNKDEFKTVLEHHFWQKLEEGLNEKLKEDKPIVDPRRKYSFDKIHKYYCNKKNRFERAFGLIYIIPNKESFRIQRDEKDVISYGSFNEKEWKWTESKKQIYTKKMKIDPNDSKTTMANMAEELVKEIYNSLDIK
jgi:hypothetical protein